MFGDVIGCKHRGLRTATRLTQTQPDQCRRSRGRLWDLVTQRRWQGMVLGRLVRAETADDGGPGLASAAEGLIGD
jgi:hypothetical protein